MERRLIRKSATLLAVAFAALGSSPVHAQDVAAPVAEPAKPSVTAKLVPELGLVLTSGNTKTTSINSVANGNLTVGKASIEAYFKSLFSKSQVYRPDPAIPPSTTPPGTSSPRNETTASKYEMGAKPAYSISDHMYLFGTLDYVDDKFSGFDWVVTETGGLGVKAIDEKTVTLKFEGGPGGKHTRTLPTPGPPKVDQVRSNDFIGRVAISFLWKMTDTSSLGEEVNTVFGPKATGGITTDSTTSLTSQIIGRLSLKASFNVRYLTEPPDVDPDTDGTPQDAKAIDTKTAIAFVYTFDWDDVGGLK